MGRAKQKCVLVVLIHGTERLFEHPGASVCLGSGSQGQSSWLLWLTGKSSLKAEAISLIATCFKLRPRPWSVECLLPFSLF